MTDNVNGTTAWRLGDLERRMGKKADSEDLRRAEERMERVEGKIDRLFFAVLALFVALAANLLYLALANPMG